MPFAFFSLPTRRCTLIAATLFIVSAATHAQNRPALDVPYIKTPPAVVRHMLEISQVSPDDYLIDLGSGDGRIPIAAARHHGTRGLGVDIDAERTAEAMTAAQAAGVSDRLNFRTENLFNTDLEQATVISMYLFPEINLRLRPYLLTLKPGTRIVSHAFHMDEWTPDRHDVVKGRDVFLWTVPARAEGLWRVSTPGYHDFVLRIWQQFNRIQGAAITQDERSIPASGMMISGPHIEFTLNTTEGVYTFSGEVDGERMSGEAGDAGEWTAQKM